jgi:hypothetical protein
MRTTVPHIYAAGDVAQGRDFSTGEWVVHALAAHRHGARPGGGAQHAGQGRGLPWQPEHECARHRGPDFAHLWLVAWQCHREATTPRWWTRPTSSTPACVLMATNLIGAITIGHPHHVGAIRGPDPVAPPSGCLERPADEEPAPGDGCVCGTEQRVKQLRCLSIGLEVGRGVARRWRAQWRKQAGRRYPARTGSHWRLQARLWRLFTRVEECNGAFQLLCLT